MSGEQEFNVSDDVKALVNEIIEKNDWGPVADIKYYPGTEAGDGYASNHVRVEIIRPAGTIGLFIKYSLDFKATRFLPVDKFYRNEIYFYDVVIPAYQQLLIKKKVGNGFKHVPKFYGSSSKNVIVLENLKDKGYTLFDRRSIMDDNHITLVLKTFAKFHATSFALKDKAKGVYHKLLAKWSGDMTIPKSSPMRKMCVHPIQEGLNTLDPIKDKSILDRCNAESLNDFIVDVQKHQNEYSIFTQGDCWCNNMMFKYEDGNNSNPIDVMLVDWQLFRPLSPVFDISYFFYTIASEESLAKLDTYLEMYYTELSNHLKQMGSDPKKMYPKVIFLKEWKQYCKFGFGMAFIVIKLMLVNRNEVPKLGDADLGKGEKIELFSKSDNDAEFARRLRTLAYFMVDRDYI